MVLRNDEGDRSAAVRLGGERQGLRGAALVLQGVGLRMDVRRAVGVGRDWMVEA